MADFAFNLAAGAILAVAGAWIGVRAYYRQQWWDRKWEGYAALIEAFLHLALQFRSMADLELVEWSSDQMAAAKARISDSLLQVNRSEAFGEMICSTEARKVLQAFRRTWNTHVDQARPDMTSVASMKAYIAGGQQLAELALDDIRKAAMKDLRLGRDRAGRLLRL